ncbi:MAG: hypothetical protein IJ410_05815 [Oscillospiraceae bacterium]|nr:hypothetical protein [Oscillospiraceae bacterium]
MKYRKEDMLDLNEENVRNLLAYCAATPRTAPDDIISANFFSADSKMNIPDLKFSKSKIDEKRYTILYMLSQLKCIHDDSVFATVADGSHKYDGTVWSTNNAAVFSLYYLGCASNTFPVFRPDTVANAFLAKLADLDFVFLQPTLSPNDPEFPAWVAEHIK